MSSNEPLTLEQAIGVAEGYYTRKQFSAAQAICEAVLKYQPEHLRALELMGVIAFISNQPEIAKQFFSKLYAQDPNNAHFLTSLGAAYSQTGDLQKALELFQKSLKLDSKNAETYYNIGTVLQTIGNYDDAEKYYLRALDLAPNFDATYNNLATICLEHGEIDKALQYLELALQFTPEDPRVYNNLAQAHLAKTNYSQAFFYVQQAIKLNPKFADAYCSYGMIYDYMGQSNLALEKFRESIALEPDKPNFHVNMALTLLALGDFDNGFKEYEWRLKVPGFSFLLSQYSQPLWQGEDLSGQTLLINTEQGFGDAIQFIHMAKNIKTKKNKIIFRVREPLRKICETIPWIDEVVTTKQALPHFDKQIPLMSILNVTKFNPYKFSPHVPYITPSEELLAIWKDKIPKKKHFKIGICWSGNAKQKINIFRKCSIESFAKFKINDNVQLFNLQLEASQEELDFMKMNNIINLMPQVTDFIDTAALIKQMDLVISVETSVPHLAGALGKKTWLLQTALPEWRFLLKNQAAFSYPTMRVFQQKELGNWVDILMEIQNQLYLLLEHNNEH